MIACKVQIQTQIIKTQTQTLLKNSLEQNKQTKKGEVEGNKVTESLL